MTVKPLNRNSALQLNRELKRDKKRKGRLIKTPKSVEVFYRKELLLMVRDLKTGVSTHIIPALKALEAEYVNDAYATSLEASFTALRRQYTGVNKNAKIMAKAFTKRANKANKLRFYAAMKESIGVDLKAAMKSEGIEDTLIIKTHENVNLIKSIPADYFEDLERIVFTGTTGGDDAGSMVSKIRTLNKSTEKRAVVIARDQTTKFNAALSAERQQNLGVVEYIWRIADDNARESHKIKNGKIFKWSSPPKDTGHPGQDVLCRCIAQPVMPL